MLIYIWLYWNKNNNYYEKFQPEVNTSIIIQFKNCQFVGHFNEVQDNMIMKSNIIILPEIIKWGFVMVPD